MAGRLEGTVALITGASIGIGEATAFTLASEGAALSIELNELLLRPSEQAD